MSDRCRFTPDTCMDDLCRGSDQGLCGNLRSDLFEDWGDDGIDDEYPPDFGDDFATDDENRE